MSNELSTYKRNRINEITNLYNSSISRLYSILLANVRNVQSSKQILKTKQTQINNLITQYNINVNTLKNTFNKNII